MEIERTASIGWASSGSAFFLNNNLGSNVSEAYWYFPAEDRRVDLNDLLYEKFPKDRRFAENSHHYVNGVRWIDENTILIKRFGHFDRNNRGAKGFTICYKINATGEVKRLLETHQENSSCPAP